MPDIQVGDYVRINNDFRVIALGIGKVIKINQDTIYVKMSFEMPFTFKKENITKHSPNLIELVECGDYVNGELITEIDKEINNKTIIGNETCYMEERDIESIVTREQFNSVMYKVKE